MLAQCEPRCSKNKYTLPCRLARAIDHRKFTGRSRNFCGMVPPISCSQGLCSALCLFQSDPQRAWHACGRLLIGCVCLHATSSRSYQRFRVTGLARMEVVLHAPPSKRWRLGGRPARAWPPGFGDRPAHRYRHTTAPATCLPGSGPPVLQSRPRALVQAPALVVEIAQAAMPVVALSIA